MVNKGRDLQGWRKLSGPHSLHLGVQSHSDIPGALLNVVILAYSFQYQTWRKSDLKELFEAELNPQLITEWIVGKCFFVPSPTSEEWIAFFFGKSMSS